MKRITLILLFHVVYVHYNNILKIMISLIFNEFDMAKVDHLLILIISDSNLEQLSLILIFFYFTLFFAKLISLTLTSMSLIWASLFCTIG